MLMFREEKSPDDEIKAWQFWHGRQHSVKQRILDAGECDKVYRYFIVILRYDVPPGVRGKNTRKKKTHEDVD